MPYAFPRGNAQQDYYRRQLQEAYGSTRRVAPYAPAPPVPTARDPIADLKELALLHQSGALTDAEFAAAKARGSRPRRRPDMTDNAARAAALVRALHAGVERDRSVILDAFTDDVRAWTPASSTSSLRDLLEQLDRRDDAFSEVELEVAPLDVGGEYACAEWIVTMTHTGPLAVAGGKVVDPTGTRVPCTA